MEIKNEHIEEAEALLINGQKFDEYERIPFIKNLKSCDLLAVPGSGKTTALLAKLYCLSKHLPFDDGSGVLVLSHTNAAVDEIEKNLKSYSPKLFEYPNFIGTVQSFVNKFLANPACLTKYGSYLSINDKDIYEREALKFFHSLEWKKTEPKGLKNKLLGRLNIGKENIEWNEKIENIIKFCKYFELNITERKILYNASSFYTFSGKSQSYYLEIERWKENLFQRGILNYRDSFYLAEWFISQYPVIVSLLKKRFKCVFIDEMQDLETYQIELIDKIFYHTNSSTVVQRIGDINQAIYNSGKMVKVEADWKPRNQMYLNGSNRLTKENAAIVNCFTLDRQQNEDGTPRFVVEGRKELAQPIKPHLILFEQHDEENLTGKFKELIQQYKLEQTEEGKKHGFKIIGWNAKWEDGEKHDGKLRLEDIFTGYKKETSTNKENHDCLSKYLQFFDHSKSSLKEASGSIINALVTILRLEAKKAIITIRGVEVEREYTKTALLRHIQNEENGCDYKLFKQKIYNWSFFLATKQDCEVVYEDIKAFILKEFKNWFDFNVGQETSSFLGEQFVQYTYHDVDVPKEPVRIDIGTVHSAKGQTHCATMYVETSYYSYETQKPKILDSLKNENHGFVVSDKKDIRGKEALKMMYVGFSRPTHLLCFAALKSNIVDDDNDYSNIVEGYQNKGWEVIDLTK